MFPSGLCDPSRWFTAVPSLPVPSLYITALPCGAATTNFGTLQTSGPACKLRSTLNLSRHAAKALCSFVEGYVTITVSCAPAASSFWVHYSTKSEVYSALRSSLRLLLSTRSKGSKATSSISHESRAPRVGPRANLSHSKNSYIELEDAANHGPRTNIFSRGPGLHEGNGVLTETTIDQSINSSRNSVWIWLKHDFLNDPPASGVWPLTST